MLRKLRGGFPGKAILTGPSLGPDILRYAEGQLAKACVCPQSFKSGACGSHMMSPRSPSASLAQESQLKCSGDIIQTDAFNSGHKARDCGS